MDSKPLIAVNLTDNRDNVYFDDTPYTTARLSPATRKAYEEAAQASSMLRLKGLKLPLLFGGYVLVALGAIVLVRTLLTAPDEEVGT